MLFKDDTRPALMMPTARVFTESLPLGGVVEWLENAQIVLYKPPHSGQDVLAELFARAEQIVMAWPANQPHLTILDLSGDKIRYTPYLRDHGRQLGEMRPELQMATALLAPRTFMAQILDMTVRIASRSKRPLTMQFSREAAVLWLKKVGGIR